MPKVKEIMSKGIITVTDDANIFDIAEIMSDYGISGMAVQDENGSLEGVVTESDIMRALSAAEERDFASITALDLMTPVTITVGPEMDMEEVCDFMVREHVHRFVVAVDEKMERAQVGRQYRHRPIGMVTTKDIVRMFARGD